MKKQSSSKKQRKAQNRSRIKAILTPEPTSAREGGQSNPVRTSAVEEPLSTAIASADETAAMATRIMKRTEAEHPETALRAANLLMSLCGYEKRPQKAVPHAHGYTVVDLLQELLSGRGDEGGAGGRAGSGGTSSAGKAVPPAGPQ